MTHKIVVVYQSLLGIYGDRGNAKVLLKRLHEAHQRQHDDVALLEDKIH